MKTSHLFLSELTAEAKKTYTHQGALAIVSPSGKMIYLPFEITADEIKFAASDGPKQLEYMFSSIVAKFMAAMSEKDFIDRYKYY